MNILGIHHGHDSCAALVRDGRIVADAAEERFTGIKHYCGLPFHAVGFCLEAAEIGMDDIDVIAIASCLQRPEVNHLFEFPSAKRQRESVPRRVLNRLRETRGYAPPHPPLYVRPFKVAPHTEVINVEHHLAHASSAAWTSGFAEKQLVVTMDGSGDHFSTCLWRAEGGRISPLQKWGFEGSIGAFYSLVTEALGWWHGDGEGKTMGLAPYGDPNHAAGSLDGLYPRFAKGELVGAKDFGRPQTWNEQGAMHFHLREAEKVQVIIGRIGRENAAAEAQRILEEQVSDLIFSWLEKEGHSNLSCSGGVFLNVKLNQRLWESGKLANQWIFPNPGDSGLAAGAALHAWRSHAPLAPAHRLEHLYLGPAFVENDARRLLELRKVPFKKMEDPVPFTAEALARNEIVAWVQGRMESGPRALGNRSILMSAGRAENKDVINARVKFREAFRPFCPSLVDEHKNDYLLNSREEPFMITSFTCPENKRADVPAVVHADGTLRPQTVKEEMNPKYHELLEEFGKLTGDPLLLNTSLNLMGQPIAQGSREAIRCFFDNGIDHLILGNLLVSKSEL